MSLTPKTKQALKGRAHALKPVVLIGNQGLTAAVSKEIDRALNDHELIKIRVASNDRELRRALISEICTAQGAELVQLIGNIGVLFRKNLT
jgi:RNA-binding protein